MANIGLRKFWYAELDTEADTYGEIQTLAGAIESKMSLTTTNAELYSDDELNDKVDEFVKASLTLGIDNDNDKVFAGLLGQTAKKLVNGVFEYTQKTTDQPIFVGFSQIVTKREKGHYKYKAEFLKKVQFKPFSTDKKTKGESLEFATPSVEGTIYPHNGEWEKHATFDNEKDAIEYIKLCFGAESQLAYAVEDTEQENTQSEGNV